MIITNSVLHFKECQVLKITDLANRWPWHTVGVDILDIQFQLVFNCILREIALKMMQSLQGPE
jgi:hypothetical protein